MPDKITNKGNKKVVMAAGADHISTLRMSSSNTSSHSIHHVRPCRPLASPMKVCARLRINDNDNFCSVQQMNKLVPHLVHRERTPLYVSELDSFHNGEFAK
uniref:Uncharacterized protein n=1 Tax=Oryza punctata TaxID=4537 RepID=A0A0E0MEG4_ORYPU